MIVTKDTITLESKEDRQILWDAIYHYAVYCYDMSKSEHFGADAFAEHFEYAEKKVQTPMYEAWDDILH